MHESNRRNHFEECGYEKQKRTSKAHRTQNTYVDQLGVVSLPQVMQNRSVVKIGQVGHIFGFLVFWRIDLLEEIFLQITGLHRRVSVLCCWGKRTDFVISIILK